jgi:hypothetical protein
VWPTGGIAMSTARKLQVTDYEIEKIISLREIKKLLSKKLDKLDKELKKEETELIEVISLGAEVDSNFNVSINESFKTYPKYKEEILRRLGQDTIDDIIQSTEPIRSQKLVISG